MRGLHPVALALVVVLAAPTAFAAFTDTSPDEDGQWPGVEASDTTQTSTTSTRSFRIDNTDPVPVYVKLTGNDGEDVYLSEAGYVVDVYLSKDNGTTWTQVAADVDHTDPSSSVDMTSSDEPAVRFVMHYPETRPVRVVPLAFHVALSDANSGGQNGGALDSSFTNSVTLNFYDETSDGNGDTLPDAWQYDNFGTVQGVDAGPDGDPDQDGSTNTQEQAYGTDPNNSQDKPPEENPPPGGEDPPGGGGVKVPEDGLLFLAVLAQVVLGLAALGGIVLAKRRMGYGFTDQKVLRVWGPSAALMLVAFLVLWLLEISPGTGKGWAAWMYPGMTPGESFWTTIAGLLVVLYGLLAAKRSPQGQQPTVAARVLAVLGVVSATSLLFFGLWEVPGPLG